MKSSESSWWSDERFWKEFGPLMFDRNRWESASAEIDGVLNLTGQTDSASILDVGCGPGRHCIDLAGRGFHAVGIDYNAEFLAEAQRRASLEGVGDRVEFIETDMRKYREKDRFSGALSLFQSIGYFDDENDDLKSCRRVYEALQPGGWFFVEMDGKEALASNFEERTWLERDDRIILLEYAAEAAWTRLRNRWLFRDRDGEWYRYEFSYRLYSALELGQMLAEAGFDTVEFFGDFDGRPYNHQARRLVAIARKA